MKTLLLFLAICYSATKLQADSPLTSTFFCEAYMDISIIKAASQTNGTLTREMMLFLSEKNPIDQKVALVNAIGWNFDGQNNFEVYNKFLSENGFGKGKINSENKLILAYFKAMDNYFDCKEALAMADIALSENPKSYTFNIIHGLIKAQVAFDTDWCKVYQSTNQVRENSRLKKDMRPQAISIIFEYMDLYAADCK